MRALHRIVGCLVALGLALPVLAAGAAEPAKVTIGPRVGLLGAAAGSVWAPDQTNRLVRIDAASGKVLARLATGDRPFHALSAAGSIWVTNLYSSTVARIDPRTNRVVARIPVGARPYGLATGGGAIWVSNSAEGTVSRIDPRTNKVVKSFDAGAEPNGLLHAYGALWVGDYGSGKLLKLDPASGRVLQRWPIAHADWVTASPGTLWVSSEPGRIVRIDPKTGAVKATIKVGVNPLATAWIGGELWVPSIDDDSVSIVDPATNRVRDTRKAGFGPASVVQAGGSVWVSDSEDGDIWRLPLR
jgi:YVTN family beta-propeller protein